MSQNRIHLLRRYIIWPYKEFEIVKSINLSQLLTLMLFDGALRPSLQIGMCIHSYRIINFENVNFHLIVSLLCFMSNLTFSYYSLHCIKKDRMVMCEPQASSLQQAEIRLQLHTS